MDINLGFLAIGSLFFLACQNNTPINEYKTETVEVLETVMEQGGIKLSTNHQATSFDDAQLNLIFPNAEFLDPGAHVFRFEVKNFDLAVPTSDVLTGQCANSKEGQHIHYIMNNEAYNAYYEAEFEEEVGEGHNVLLAFLSRSYHMSVKNKKAYVLKEFHSNNAEDNFDKEAPHLFYSRPKGKYFGNDAHKIMLDFYLVNTDLKDKNYIVKATINELVFEIESWEPYFIEGLQEGEHKIKLELMDKQGNLVKSPFNPVERKIIVNFNEETI